MTAGEYVSAFATIILRAPSASGPMEIVCWVLMGGNVELVVIAGLRAARALVRYCIYQSMASHPPCNIGNSCTMIVEEIRRNLAGDRDSVTLPGANQLNRAAWRRVARLHAI